MYICVYIYIHVNIWKHFHHRRLGVAGSASGHAEGTLPGPRAPHGGRASIWGLPGGSGSLFNLFKGVHKGFYKGSLKGSSKGSIGCPIRVSISVHGLFMGTRIMGLSK